MRPIEPAAAWWPDHLGSPDAVGSQNDVRYAYFGDARRLIVDADGVVSLYDAADHAIGGIAQAQGDRRHLVFTSQHGPVSLDALRRVER